MLNEEIKLIDGIITTSPLETLIASNAKCIAEVPLLQVKANFEFTYFFIFSSNSLTKGPEVIKEFFNAKETLLISFLSIF